MLSLTRKPGEWIVIRDDRGNVVARIRLDHLGKGRARIGIEADRSWRILREELEPLPLVPADPERGTDAAA